MNGVVNYDPMEAWNQANFDAWYNVLQQQQQQPNIGQQLAAQPTVQQPQAQPQQVQQQVASQQQAPASVSQPQAIDQAQSQVPVQKIGTPPANVGIEGQGFDAGNGQITYQGEGHFNPVYDEMGQVVQNNWISDVPTRLSDADTSEIVTTGTGQKISRAALEQQMYGKQVGDWNMNLPAIEQGGLDIDTINVLKQLENNPNSPYGAVFNPEEWDEGSAFYNPGVSEQAEELRGLQAQGGDLTNYAGQMENLRGQEHLSLRNKATGEMVPYYQLFRDFPQQADLINTKIAEYARSHPWWKEDLAPDIIKGISTAIAAAATGGMASTAFGLGAAGTAAATGAGAAAATNAQMQGDIGDRLLPTAIAFGGGALSSYAAPYVRDFLGNVVKGIRDYMPSFGGGEPAVEAGLAGGKDALGIGNVGPGVKEAASGGRFSDLLSQATGGKPIAPLTDGAGYGGIDTLPSSYNVSPEVLEVLRSVSPESIYTPPVGQQYMTYQPTPLDQVLQSGMPTQYTTPVVPSGPGGLPTGEELAASEWLRQENVLREELPGAEDAYNRAIENPGQRIDLTPEQQEALNIRSARSAMTADEPMYIQEEGYKPIYDTQNMEDLYGKSLPEDLGPRAFESPAEENVYASFGVDPTGEPLYGFYPADPTINYPTEMDLTHPRWWADLAQLGEPTGWGDLGYAGGLSNDIWDWIKGAGTSIASILPYIKPFIDILSGKPETTGTTPGGSYHGGGSSDAQPDFSELAGLLARGAGGGGGGATGPSAGSAKGGGFGEGGMMALMNLVLNEMQKGGKYYFQT